MCIFPICLHELHKTSTVVETVFSIFPGTETVLHMFRMSNMHIPSLCFALYYLYVLRYTIYLTLAVYDDSLLFVNNTLCFHTLQIMHLHLAFLTHLSSLLLFLKTIQKKTKQNSRNKSQKRFLNENKCM